VTVTKVAQAQLRSGQEVDECKRLPGSNSLPSEPGYPPPADPPPPPPLLLSAAFLGSTLASPPLSVLCRSPATPRTPSMDNSPCPCSLSSLSLCVAPQVEIETNT